MTNKNSHKRISRGLYKRVSSTGQAYYLTYDGQDGNGKPIWSTWDTKEQAEEHQRQLRVQKANEGRRTWGLPAEQREDAARALELLSAYPGAKLVHSAAYYVDHVLKQQKKTVREAFDELMAQKQNQNLRAKSLKSLRRRMGKVVGAFGDRVMSSVTVDELQRFVDTSGKAPRTRIGFAAAASQLWKFALKRRWVGENVAALVDRPKPDDSETESFTVEECERLLRAAPEIGMLAYVAIGLFVGVRREEMCRISWSKISLSQRTITIGKSEAKKRSRRVIKFNDTLAAWLEGHCKPSGWLLPGARDETTVNELLRELAKRARVRWIQNGIRHSFASYHLAKHNDITTLAYIMAEKDPSVIYNHYASLRTPDEAERFWALRPH